MSVRGPGAHSHNITGDVVTNYRIFSNDFKQAQQMWNGPLVKSRQAMR